MITNMFPAFCLLDLNLDLLDMFCKVWLTALLD